MALKDKEARRDYMRLWEERRRRARGVPVGTMQPALRPIKPWEALGMSRRPLVVPLPLAGAGAVALAVTGSAALTRALILPSRSGRARGDVDDVLAGLFIWGVQGTGDAAISSQYVPVDAGHANRVGVYHCVVDDVIDHIRAGRADVLMQRKIAGAVAVKIADAVQANIRANLGDNCAGLNHVVLYC